MSQVTNLSIIVALNSAFAIGRDNKLPWHIAEDLAHFKEKTLDKTIIMGRKTFESLGRVLPRRKHIVISKTMSSDLQNGVIVYPSLKEAVSACDKDEEVFIIGGGEIFREAIYTDIINKMYITMVDLYIHDATVFFPNVNFLGWERIKKKDIIAKNGIKCSFMELVRKKYD